MLSHESQALMNSLQALCADTLSLAASLGTVLIVTNSVPGWVDQSCQLFMTQLAQHVRGLHIVARPMHAPLTFKTSAFQREVRQYKNVISIGDGNAERTATLRLQMLPDTGDPKEPLRSIKSVKLIELPTCHQLHAEHEMLQQRLPDIVGFRGHLDLKARFAMNPSGLTPSSKLGPCTLVHFSRALGSSSPGAGVAWPSQDDNTRMSGLLGPSSLRGGGLGGAGGGLAARAGGGSRQLPMLGSGHSKTTADLDSASILDSSGSSNDMDGGTEAADMLAQAFSSATGGAGPGVVGGAGGGGRSGGHAGAGPGPLEPPASTSRRVGLEDRVGASERVGGRGTPDRDRGVESSLGGLWKAQGLDVRGGRLPYPGIGGSKKRSVLGSGLGGVPVRAGGASAAWRGESAPAGARS